MMLWVFGMIFLGSFWIIGAWGRQAWLHREPLSFYNATLCLALGMDIAAIGWSALMSVRVVDILHGAVFPTEGPVIYYAGNALVIIGKSLVVWVAALHSGREYSKVLWWSYVWTSAAWTWFCILWSL